MTTPNYLSCLYEGRIYYLYYLSAIIISSQIPISQLHFNGTSNSDVQYGYAHG